MITCGGDAGWRFANCPQWHSTGGLLLFDAEKWNVDSIAAAMKTLYREVQKQGVTWTLAETLDKGYVAIKPFIEDTDGVYVDDEYRDEDGFCRLGFTNVDKSKHINGSDHEVERWSKNGEESNYNYR